MNISEEVKALAKEAQKDITPIFEALDEISQENTQKVLSAFHKHRVSDSDFGGTTGYGYDDMGRDKLDKIYAEIFQTESALVRIQFVNGTHTLSCALFGNLRPNDVLLSAVGAPYDTLLGVIGVSDKGTGSLKDFGVSYRQVDVLKGDRKKPDLIGLEQSASDPAVKLILIQRSRGYATRDSLSVAEIGEMIQIIRKVNEKAIIMVDNCYGEFVETLEPSQVGADLVVGSLIKNPGGGLAPTGGYIAGKKEYVDAAAQRLTCPSIGGECGATLGNNRLLYQGLFMAPHTVNQALKTAIFAARMMELLGYQAQPTWKEPRYDIVQMLHTKEPEAVKAFCRGIQKGAPVDSYVTPEPWDMPGYDVPVIMAAGAFIQGASIELSADAPMREPYTVYIQGGLTYESGKLGILLAATEILNHKNQSN